MHSDQQLSAEMERKLKNWIATQYGTAGWEQKLTNFLATALDEQATSHAMRMAGMEAQIEQKAVIRASELLAEREKKKMTDETEQIVSESAEVGVFIRKSERTKIIEEVLELVHGVQKSCAGADGTIDGITATHEVIAKLEAMKER